MRHARWVSVWGIEAGIGRQQTRTYFGASRGARLFEPQHFQSSERGCSFRMRFWLARLLRVTDPRSGAVWDNSRSGGAYNFLHDKSRWSCFSRATA